MLTKMASTSPTFWTAFRPGVPQHVLYGAAHKESAVGLLLVIDPTLHSPGSDHRHVDVFDWCTVHAPYRAKHLGKFAAFVDMSFAFADDNIFDERLDLATVARYSCAVARGFKFERVDQ